MQVTKETFITGILIILMLLTGTVNTIATKYQDIQCVEYNAKGECVRRFEHFAVQSAEMFMGEMLCLLPTLISFMYNSFMDCRGSGEKENRLTWGRRAKAAVSFAVPAMCDVSGTTLLNVGIFFTYPSVYQMLRGTVVFFAGMFTYTLLGKKLSKAQWFSLVLIVLGAGIVGCVSVLKIGKGGHTDNSNATNPLLGNILVVSAQLAAAFQFIIEEKYLGTYGVKPHLAVGLEGCWGFLACMIILPIMKQMKTSSGEPLDDLSEAIEQIKASRPLLIATLGSIFSIAFFNFFGITLTKRLSGASRATIDACRTLFVWMYSLHVGWEQKSLVKNLLQVVGFIVLISGTSMFNGIIRGPGDKKKKKKSRALPHMAGDLDEPLLEARDQSKSQGGGLPMRRLVSNTMARSFRLGRSMFTFSPSTSRAGSVANTPSQTPRYGGGGRGGSSSLPFGKAHDMYSQELPSSYESKVNLDGGRDMSSVSEEQTVLENNVQNSYTSNPELEETFE
jgi:drug/metabolite transporter (DMT)-like permease